ncbi:unnamed protein product [Rhizophagus irregularis]|nr:unnamed protein product [Rhizophagus irregularis]CAB5381695.1 unnamed protein product [Rhizophagus irregularis]
MIGVHLETLPTVRLSVKGKMGMEDTINDDGPYCVKEAETSSEPISKPISKEAERQVPDSHIEGFHIEGTRN